MPAFKYTGKIMSKTGRIRYIYNRGGRGGTRANKTAATGIKGYSRLTVSNRSGTTGRSLEVRRSNAATGATLRTPLGPIKQTTVTSSRGGSGMPRTYQNPTHSSLRRIAALANRVRLGG